MKYLIIGAGGVGGAVGGFLAAGGKDVTLIARGAHLAAIQEKGLHLRSDRLGCDRFLPIPACTAEEYAEKADVIFVCVKGYGLPGVLPLLQRACHERTLVIPLLNIYGTGGRIAQELPGITVTDGCIYIVSQITAPGEIAQDGTIFRVVYGLREPAEDDRLSAVARDLADCAIDPVVSDNIRRDALAKFAYVSPIGCAGCYYHVPAGAFRQPGEMRDTFFALTAEIDAIAQAQGTPFLTDIIAVNDRILSEVDPASTTSMQRDLAAGRPTEMDGLLFEVVRMGRALGVPTPTYEKIARRFGFSE